MGVAIMPQVPPLGISPSLGIYSKSRSRVSANHVAVCRQGICVEYSVEYSKCRALNDILVSTVDDCRLLNWSKAFLVVDSGA
eukprot:4500273-Pyramimonas_sp.AAC.1